MWPKEKEKAVVMFEIQYIGGDEGQSDVCTSSLSIIVTCSMKCCYFRNVRTIRHFVAYILSGFGVRSSPWTFRYRVSFV